MKINKRKQTHDETRRPWLRGLRARQTRICERLFCFSRSPRKWGRSAWCTLAVVRREAEANKRQNPSDAAVVKQTTMDFKHRREHRRTSVERVSMSGSSPWSSSLKQSRAASSRVVSFLCRRISSSGEPAKDARSLTERGRPDDRYTYSCTQ